MMEQFTGITHEHSRNFGPLARLFANVQLSANYSLQESLVEFATVSKNLLDVDAFNSYVTISCSNGDELFRDKGTVLTAAEISAIFLYTADCGFHKVLNTFIQSGDRATLIASVKYIWLLMNALSKCPLSPARTVFSGITFETEAERANFAQYHKQGRKICWNKFSSCLVCMNLLMVGSSDYPIIFSIELTTDRARNISAYSFNKDEKEILLPVNSRFEVKFVHYIEGKHINCNDEYGNDIEKCSRNTTIVIDLLELPPDDPILEFSPDFQLSSCVAIVSTSPASSRCDDLSTTLDVLSSPPPPPPATLSSSHRVASLPTTCKKSTDNGNNDSRFDQPTAPISKQHTFTISPANIQSSNATPAEDDHLSAVRRASVNDCTRNHSNINIFRGSNSDSHLMAHSMEEAVRERMVSLESYLRPAPTTPGAATVAGFKHQHRNNQASDIEYLMKLLMIGDSGVGKSSFLLRYTDNTFDHKSTSTMGIDFKLKYINCGQYNVRLQVWDTAGQERFSSLNNSYYRHAMGIFLLYDVTNIASFEHVRHWNDNISKFADENVLRVLIGHKSDMPSKSRKISFQQGQALAAELGIIIFLETSALSNHNIDDAFSIMSNTILRRIKKNPKKYSNTIKIIAEENMKSLCC